MIFCYVFLYCLAAETLAQEVDKCKAGVAEASESRKRNDCPLTQRADVEVDQAFLDYMRTKARLTDKTSKPYETGMRRYERAG